MSAPLARRVAAVATPKNNQTDSAASSLEWWKQPLEDWRSGRLEIRNLLTGERTVIRLSDGAILVRTFADD
jgi:hypothetical protein